MRNQRRHGQVAHAHQIAQATLDATAAGLLLDAIIVAGTVTSDGRLRSWFQKFQAEELEVTRKEMIGK